jgi:hypothetical protein
MIIYIIAPISAIFLLKWFTRRDPTPICGIYKQKNKWYPVKYWVFRFMVIQLTRGLSEGKICALSMSSGVFLDRIP